MMTFEEIYREYSERVLNLVYRMTSREEVARDLTQEIFVKVYEHLGTYNEQSRIFTWIHAIAVNHVMNYLNREKTIRWFRLMDDTAEEYLHHKQAAIPGWGEQRPAQADSALELKERVKLVWCAVQSLDPKYRLPLVLHHYERISYKDIAEILGITLSTVESRIHRAKEQLIKKLGPVVNQL